MDFERINIVNFDHLSFDKIKKLTGECAYYANSQVNKNLSTLKS